MSALLALAAIFSLSGCAGASDTSYIATVGEEKIPAGVYLYYQLTSFYEALEKSDTLDSEALFKTKVEDMDASEWINAQAMRLTREHVAVRALAAELNITLPTETQGSLLNTLESRWESYSDIFLKNGIAKTSLRRVFENQLLRSDLFSHYYGASGTNPIPKEEMDEAFSQDYARIQFLTVSKLDPATGEDLEDDALAAAKERAEEYIRRARAGEDFSQLIIESAKLDEELKAQAQEEEENDSEESSSEASSSEDAQPEEDEAEQTDEEKYAANTQDLIVSRTSTYYQQDLLTHIFDNSAVGGVAMYEDDGYYLVYLRKDIFADRTDLLYYEEEVRSALREDDFKTMLSEKTQAMGFSENTKAAARYKPKNLTPLA
jgi:hypothetical protein